MWNWLRRLFRRETPVSAVPSTQGTVKRIVRDKGFGFIRSADGQEVFFHRSALVGLELRGLYEGQQVEFLLEEGPKGFRATSVRRTSEDSEDRRSEQRGAPGNATEAEGDGRARRGKDRQQSGYRRDRGRHPGGEGKKSRGEG